MTATELEPYDIRDHSMLMRDIACRCRLEEGTVHVALVESVSTTQRVVRVERIQMPAEILDWDEARQELRRVVEGWPEAQVVSPRPLCTPVLIVTRPGLCVFGPNEAQWSNAERYANFIGSVWSAQLVLVTEHGWLDLMTYAAGQRPAMVRRILPVVSPGPSRD